MNLTTRWKAPVALGVAGAAVIAAGGFGLMKAGVFRNDNDEYTAAPITNATLAQISISNGSTGVAPNTPLVLTAPPGETIGSVTVADATAHSVAGTYSPDRRTWTSQNDLRVSDAYQVTAVTTKAADNGVGIEHASFQTTTEPDSLKFDSVFPTAGSTVGVGQPVVITFTQPVKDKAAIERALTVTSSPQQTGSWGWLSDTRVDYRPQSYWKTGTKVYVNMAFDGVDLGGGKFGAKDHQVAFTVGRDQETTINVSSDVAVVDRSGSQIHSFTVSGGMPGLDTWDGTYAVIDKATDIVMDSRTAGLGDAYYEPDVKWDVHFTSSGTYVHSAPWSVGAQGHENVSHGCVNTNPADAQWFYENTLPGDIIKVVGSPRTAALGNGFNDWQLSWADWQGKSALSNS
ncbi:L,D-transpeptidase [Actinospica robiniae]|uniref:L,D-transpeptidase n=1 Tax=Actinospica robiniae TaxID=304901 RepID=UPI00146FADCF|nr:Ig-like domain-containing protein [Actinospica robiniae]